MKLKVKNNTQDKAQSKASRKAVIVTDEVGNYEKHPFFIKKAATAKSVLLKVGLPKQLAKKSQA